MIRKKNQLTLMSMLIGKCMLMRVLVLHTPMQPYHAAVTALSSSSSSNSGTSKARYSSRAGKPRKIAIIGGGASGMFASVNLSKACKESNLDQEVEVHVLEATSKLMSKVQISGGGRCNVLHDTSKPVSDVLNGYPRGKKELIGLFNKHFSPQDAEKWFRDRGVQLKTEGDGRMFPVTDSSQTIMDCITDAAEKYNVHVNTRQKVLSIEKAIAQEDEVGEEDEFENGFTVSLKSGDEQEHHHYDRVIVATGSNPNGYNLCKHLGHKIVPPVPSLFTLNTKHQNKEEQVFHNLSGLSVQNTIVTLKVKVEGKKKKMIMQQQGPLLITHHGISGPAVLRLSAFAAREFKDLNYRGDVLVHWAPEFGSAQDIHDELWKMKSLAPKRSIASACPLMGENRASVIPKRLWASLVLVETSCGFERDTTWAEANKKQVGSLARTIAEFVVDVTGKGVFKEEFVTAGGVSLREINMKTMESKKCPGLYFCGEVIDVDGVTGGYNFMNCWSTGFMAASSCASSL